MSHPGILDIVFAFFAVLTAASGLLVVILRNLLHAAVALFFCLTGIATIYVILGADFLGMAQLLIYAGGILVLLIFGIFLTAKIYDTKVEIAGKGPPWYVGVGVSAVTFVVIASVLLGGQFIEKTPVAVPTTRVLGNLFLTKYLLPFELVSVLLLFAMIGAVILVRKEVK
ncbi:MAG: NADH-quinone oxidoreductase subunit J [Pseudomonadota bacterium]